MLVSLHDPTETDDEFTADVLQFLTTREVAYRKGLPLAPVGMQ